MNGQATLLAIVLLAASCAACIGPRAPSARAPFAVRLLGADDGGLLGTTRAGRHVFTGSTGRDYAIEVTNDTHAEVGMTIVIDGLDAHTGRPVSSCEDLGGWELASDSTAIMRGFSVSRTQLASYRFAPRDRALAAITSGARRDAIGTIEVCFFSLKPGPAHGDDGPASFGAVVEHEPGPDAPVSELRDQELSKTTDYLNDELIARIVVAYEDENGIPLGTAPPPAGIARVAPERASPARTAPSGDEVERRDDGPKSARPGKPVKPRKPVKPGKPDKGK